MNSRDKEVLDLLAGRRSGKARRQAAVRVEDLAGLLELSPKLKAKKAAGATPTKAEFDALVAELQAMSADHFGADPEAVLWEHAEMLKDWNTRLRHITDAYHRRGEYAE